MSENILKKLDKIYLAKYRFVLKPDDFIKLPGFAGSALRKALIPVFRQITCQTAERECYGCNISSKCPYNICMAENSTNSDHKFRRYHTPPKPFIFEPPINRKPYYGRKDELYFDLILLGKALEYLPYFTASIRHLGAVGIGRNQGKFKLEKIFALNLNDNGIIAEYNYDHKNSDGDNDKTLSLAELYEKFSNEDIDINEVSISIVTPLRMKLLGMDDWHLYFQSLTKNIFKRIANLAYAYCNYENFLEFPELIHKAGRIRIIKENFTWEDWRPLTMKDKKPNSRLGGYVGDIVYQGNIKDFWAILRIGEILHIGKNTSFGFGRIQVKHNNHQPAEVEYPLPEITAGE